MIPTLQRLMDRKVVQWTLGYLVGAYGVLEALGFLADLFGWGRTVVRVAAVLLMAGALATLVVSWFHGARGDQRVTRTEAGLLSLIGVAGVAGAVILGPGEETEAGPEATDPSIAAERSVAVLPPTALSGGSAGDHFVEGMHDALVSRLGRVGALRVISRTSTAKYAGTDASLPEIARELGVDDVVESSLIRRGDTVTMEVRLVEALPEERLLWSERFTAPIQDVFAMHGDVARTIAREVRVELTPDERSRLSEVRTVDPEMYEAYLRGMHQLYRGTPDAIRRGLDHLHGAVDRNPANALAYAGLAYGYVTLGHSPVPPPDAWTRAAEAAERAIALDPDLAEAHLALATVNLYWEYDWEAAEREFRRANEINPSLAMSRYHYAWYLDLVGRLDEAVVQHRLAKELDPLTPLHTANLGMLYLEQGRLDEALAEAKAALELQPDALAGLMVLGDVYTAMGRHEEAIRAHRRLAEVAPPTRWVLGRTLVVAGRVDEARRIRDQMEAAEPIPMTAFGLVILNAQLGDLDAAFRWTKHEPHHGWLAWIRVSPWAEPLRDDPRFDDFLERLDLPPVQGERSGAPVVAARD